MLQREKLSTLPDVFNQRAALTPKLTAFQFFDNRTSTWQSKTWREVFLRYLCFRRALASEKLVTGSRVMLILENCVDWICIEQAALSLGLIPVAASPMDSLQTLRHIILDTSPSLIFIESDRLVQSLQLEQNYKSIVSLQYLEGILSESIKNWLEKNKNYPTPDSVKLSPNDLATIIYTSGSSGVAKGVMLSHEAIINNAQACVDSLAITSSDKLLCVTPLSHVIGRVMDYYLGMLVGTPIVFNRALGMIDDSIKHTHPTVLNCTPYIIECAYSEVVASFPALGNFIEKYLDWANGIAPWKISFVLWGWIKKSLQRHIKNNFLYSLETIFVSGSALSTNSRKLSEILGLPIYQGYCLTEAGGAVSFNTPALNLIGSVGIPLSNTEITISDGHQVLIKTNSKMLGYWGNNSRFNEMWLQSGDIGRIENTVLQLSSRQSSVIQMANGHCVYPEPIEERIREDSIFENVLLYGQSQARLTAICQIDPDKWLEFAARFRLTTSTTLTDIFCDHKASGVLFTRVNALLQSIPSAPRVDYILPAFENWSELGLINAQGKTSRQLVEAFYKEQLSLIYQKQYPFNQSRFNR